MLQRDYILEIIEEFVNTVVVTLRRALVEHDLEAADQTEEAVAGLLDLDPSIALELAPDSLVTMMILTGIADSVAAYVSYTLGRLADVYDDAGEAQLADLRRAQAQAVSESFGCSVDDVPEGFEALGA